MSAKLIPKIWSLEMANRTSDPETGLTIQQATGDLKICSDSLMLQVYKLGIM